MGLHAEQRGGLGHCALQHLTEKKMIYLHSKGVPEKRKALLRSMGFFATAHQQILSLQWRMCLTSVCAQVGDSLWCPVQTPDTSPCLRTASRKPLQILGKWREKKPRCNAQIHTWASRVGTKQKRTNIYWSALIGRDGDHWSHSAVQVLLQTQLGHKTRY